MRIKLKKGKQKELILKAKINSNLSWKELADKLKVNSTYLSNGIKKEKTTLSLKNYSLLCDLARKDYNSFIEKKLDNFWGASKGGYNSKGNTKEIDLPSKDERLAELCGVILGDGNLNEYKKGKKIRTYSLRIAGDRNNDREYLLLFIKPLIENLFKIKTRFYNAKSANCSYIIADGIQIINFFKSIGIKSGDKIKNNQGIPIWILENKRFLKVCLRGLFDTDGSVYRMSNNDPNLLRISIKSHIPNLYKDIYNSLLKFNFKLYKNEANHQVCISKKDEIKRFINEIGFSNKKHLNRIKEFKIKQPRGVAGLAYNI